MKFDIGKLKQLDPLKQLKQINPLKGKSTNGNNQTETPIETTTLATDGETSETNTNGLFSKILNSRRNKIIAAVVACYLVLLGIGCAGALSTSTTTPETKPSETTESSILSFKIDVNSWDTSTDGNLVIEISGTDSDGAAVLEQYKAVPNTKYETDLKAGDYTIALASTKAAKGDNIFKADSVKFKFDGKANKTVVLEVALDEEAMAAVEAEEKAAEEKAEAERKAAEDQAAAEKAAAAAAAAAVASSTSSDNASSGSNATSGSGGGSSASAGTSSGGASGGTVYIPSSKKGGRYHSRATCSGMKNPSAVTVEQAQSMGYTPCAKCW